jgi:hypothetical protein
VSTVSIGSNKKYAEGWDAVFGKGKLAKKKAVPEKGKRKEASPKKKEATPKKKVKSEPVARKVSKRK